MDAGAESRVRARLDRAANLLACAAAIDASSLDDDAALRREAQRLRPHLEALVGRAYGRLPDVRFRRGLGARIAGPWSQYLTLGHPRTRRVRITPRAASRPAIPTILAHELAHRYSFDESLTTLRGLELSARLGEDGDAMHARGAARELGRLCLGAAMGEAAEAARAGAEGPASEVERFLAERDPAAIERSRSQWRRLRGRSRGPDCVTEVYAGIPCRALEAELPELGPLPYPRFRIDGAQAVAVALYTAVDALAGRRREPVAAAASLRLWRSAAG